MKPSKISMILFATVLLIGAAAYAFVRVQPQKAKVIDAATIEKSFTENHYNAMIVDTFTMLIAKAYPQLATSQQSGGVLSVQLQEASAMTKDFFNGNDELLSKKLNDNGFEIKYDAANKKVEAKFAITNNAVNVPNDVMIKIMDKIYNASKTVIPTQPKLIPTKKKAKQK
jgi:hypothetical protein